MKKTVIFLLFLFLLVSAVSANQGHMKLLAVKEIDGNYTGDSADLFLEIRPGTGRVFLETFPLTKMDTQISTRFAKEIACNYFELDCDDYDFIYTIRSSSSIIGGPSAGAAISVLTTAVVEGIELEESVAVTGTINSGGIVGPVGGLRAKIDAAEESGLRTVLIPQGTSQYKENNKTIDLKEYGQEKGILVLEASDLNELFFFFTGEKLREDDFEINVDEEYFEIMKNLGSLLCDRTAELRGELGDHELNESSGVLEKIESSEKAVEAGDYYSAASYCFGANVQLKRHVFDKKELTDKELEQKVVLLRKKFDEFEETVKERELTTITDLQTYGIVLERINEGRENLDLFEELNKTYYLAFAEERLFSAQSWSYFFAMSGKQFNLDQEALEQSCLEKIQEARERYQYVSLFIFGEDSDVVRNLDEEDEIYRSGDYKFCLIKSSYTKADANAILSTLGVEEDNLGELVEAKLGAVERSLARTISKGAFPILGYSYYQYANSLKEDDLTLALVYAEYAMELGNLDIYFEEMEEVEEVSVNPGFVIFLFGSLFGAAIVLIILILIRNDYKTPRTTRKQSGGKKR